MSDLAQCLPGKMCVDRTNPKKNGLDSTKYYTRNKLVMRSNADVFDHHSFAVYRECHFMTTLEVTHTGSVVHDGLVLGAVYGLQAN